MKLLIVSGSQRENSQSRKVADYIKTVSTSFEQVQHLELCKYPLPYWDGAAETKNASASTWPIITKQVKKADALVLITPEWGGMVTPMLKNFLLMCDSQDTAHKPALLVSVVNGISGAYPIAELRMNAFKNNKIVAMPDHLIIRDVETVLNQQASNKKAIAEESRPAKTATITMRDQNLRDRISYCLHMLHQYGQALVTVRVNHENKPYPKQQAYLYGM